MKIAVMNLVVVADDRVELDDEGLDLVDELENAFRDHQDAVAFAHGGPVHDGFDDRPGFTD